MALPHTCAKACACECCTKGFRGRYAVSPLLLIFFPLSGSGTTGMRADLRWTRKRWAKMQPPCGQLPQTSKRGPAPCYHPRSRSQHTAWIPQEVVPVISPQTVMGLLPSLLLHLKCTRPGEQRKTMSSWFFPALSPSRERLSGFKWWLFSHLRLSWASTGYHIRLQSIISCAVSQRLVEVERPWKKKRNCGNLSVTPVTAPRRRRKNISAEPSPLQHQAGPGRVYYSWSLQRGGYIHLQGGSSNLSRKHRQHNHKQ